MPAMSVMDVGVFTMMGMGVGVFAIMRVRVLRVGVPGSADVGH